LTWVAYVLVVRGLLVVMVGLYQYHDKCKQQNLTKIGLNKASPLVELSRHIVVA